MFEIKAFHGQVYQRELVTMSAFMAVFAMARQEELY